MDHELIIKRAFGGDVVLSPLSLESFYSHGFGVLDFTYDSNGLVKGFQFVGQNVRNIVFEK